MQQLVIYDEACRAIAAARSIDEVKEITNRAEAARAYARQAKNKELEINAIEIRVRAERRLGEMLLVLREDRVIGQGRGGSLIKLADIGVDKNISGGAQRLAKLALETFEREMTGWRQEATEAKFSGGLKIPLQRYRLPHIVGDRQRAAKKYGRHVVEANPLDKFTAIDGRKIKDWRAGELDRMKELAERTIRCVDALVVEMPIANPDPLDTMEMVFRDPGALEAILASVWDAAKVRPGKTGCEYETNGVNKPQRICAGCNSPFILKKKPHLDRPREGLFCSRSCAGKFGRQRGPKKEHST